jgi:hypothetical protein
MVLAPGPVSSGKRPLDFQEYAIKLHAGRSAPVEPLTNSKRSPTWAGQAYESGGISAFIDAAGSAAITGIAVAAIAIGPPGVSSGGKTIDMSAKNR